MISKEELMTPSGWKEWMSLDLTLEKETGTDISKNK